MDAEIPDYSWEVPAAVGQAACGIVHDLANLIQTIILRAEVTSATEPVSAACIKRMEQIVDDGQGGAALIRGLLEYARTRIDEMPAVDICPAVAAAVAYAGRATGLNLASSLTPDPVVGRADAPQLLDLVTLSLRELSRDADPAATYSVLFGHAKPEGGEALAWMSEDSWAQLKIERVGSGPGFELEEGHLLQNSSGGPHDERAMNLMRIRGIVRQHRGQVRVVELIDDNRLALAVEAFFPLTAT